MAAPTKHKDFEVEVPGFVPQDSMSAQLKLKGHKLLLRKITINPGGQIAKHSHEAVPGVVYIENGTWNEGREEGDTLHSAGDTLNILNQ